MKINVNHAAGVATTLLGSVVCFYSATLRFGSLSNMGPGFFPTIAGLILFASGVGIFFSRSKESLQVNISKQEAKAIVLILLSICFFSLAIGYLGMIISCTVIVLLSRYAIKHQTLKSNMMLALILTTASVLLFWYLLDLNLKLFLSFI